MHAPGACLERYVLSGQQGGGAVYEGVARLYTLDIEMCTPPGYDEEDGPPEHHPDPLPPGIPPPPTIIITDDGPVVLVGTKKINKTPERLINKTFWRQN